MQKLKIKDDVNLKELKEFGFSRPKYSEDTGEVVRYEHEKANWKWLYIDAKTRYINSAVNGYDWTKVYHEEQLQIIYDLIVAGLVEKIDMEDE